VQDSDAQSDLPALLYLPPSRRSSGGLTLAALDDGFHSHVPNGGGGTTEWGRQRAGSGRVDLAWLKRLPHRVPTRSRLSVQSSTFRRPNPMGTNRHHDAPMTVCGAIDPIAKEEENPNDLTVFKGDQTPSAKAKPAETSNSTSPTVLQGLATAAVRQEYESSIAGGVRQRLAQQDQCRGGRAD
jgi:hypothetical protein